jgi:uroporphyrinogen-III synthase
MSALSGVGVLLTRPLPQAEGLARLLREAGAMPLVFPGIEIESVQSEPLAQALGLARHADWLIFVSPTAVHLAYPLLEAAKAMPSRARIAAIGAGTARELQRSGVDAIVTPQDGQDSEALAAHPDLQAIDGQLAVMFRGEGGRDWLAQTLRQRGAQVVLAECYRRRAPQADFGRLLPDWESGSLQAWTASSGEIVDNLFELAGESGAAWLRDTIVFVPHARIAARAFARGARHVFVTAPGNAGLLDGLRSWFAQPILSNTELNQTELNHE